jgi:hypothetical protein
MNKPKPKQLHTELITGAERAALGMAIALLMNSADDCIKKDMYYAAKDREENAEILRCMAKRLGGQ